MKFWMAPTALTSGVFALGLAGAALASTTTALPDGRGYGGVSDSGRPIACDTRADNWGVRTYYTTSDGDSGLVGDGNGGKSGCGSAAPAGGGHVISYRVCAEAGGAGAVCRP